MIENLIAEVLPYAGVGVGGVIPILIVRIVQLESKLASLEITVKKHKKTFGLYYFYMSKKDTNFGVFIEKHEKNL